MPNTADDLTIRDDPTSRTQLADRVLILEETAKFNRAQRSADYLQLSKIFDQAVELRIAVRILETRVALYALIGSFLGAALMSILVNIVLDLIRK